MRKSHNYLSVFAYWILFFISFPNFAQDHILPQPQRIAYGGKTISLDNVIITIGMDPEKEDRFVATELSSIISVATGNNIEIKNSKNGRYPIVLVRTHDVDPLPLPGEKSSPEGREAYEIRITPRETRITSRSSAGLFYAVQTLRQLIKGSGEEASLPECEIEDWPELPYRGFMMDMSHTQLPKIEEIKKQLDFLARWKANQYYFYSEASIELEGYPLLMSGARFTREEVKEVIDYARERFIDVIPLMELYGHIHDLFRLEHYADLSVLPHGGEFKPYDPRVEPILRDWITQISGLFPSPFFHIGFDETWLIRSEAGKLDMPPEKLYLDMLDRTTGIVVGQGKIPMLFADMLQKFPSIIPEIKNDIIAVPWHYFPKDESEYGPLLAPFRDERIPMVVQSALINWNWVYPAFEISFKNTDLLLRMGKNHGAVGFINSGWTDDTQTIMRMSWPDLAYGSSQSWHQVDADYRSFFDKYTRALYPKSLSTLVSEALVDLWEAESLLRETLGPTDPAFFANPFTSKNLERIHDYQDHLRNGRLAAEQAQIHLMEALEHQKDTITLTAMLTGAKTLDYLALKYMYAAEIDKMWNDLWQSDNPEDLIGNFIMEVTFKYHTRTQDMLDAVTELKRIYKKTWLNEYQPFRLDVGLGKYDLEFQYWLKLQRRMDNFCRQYESGQEWPSLETMFK